MLNPRYVPNLHLQSTYTNGNRATLEKPKFTRSLNENNPTSGKRAFNGDATRVSRAQLPEYPTSNISNTTGSISSLLDVLQTFSGSDLGALRRTPPDSSFDSNSHSPCPPRAAERTLRARRRRANAQGLPEE